MSMMAGMGRTFEVGETVASFKEYEAAQKAVSRLIASEVPAADIAIVGTALRSIEKVTGRLGYAQAAWSGAVNGVLLGLLFAAMVVIWSPGIPMQVFVGMMFVGIAIGMLVRLISYALLRRRRDFASVMQVAADHYEVTVLPRSVGTARRVLGPSAPPRPVTPSSSPSLSEPPRYGVRIDPATPPAPEAEAPEGPEGAAPEDEGRGDDRGRA
ncbi:general stress protein [Microbacterium album]|uniref:General stress protein 17M-like domain-containing protein n=1 Tax=Microbacterium album TaxID=2053191 RepID=A0A917MMU5_9MICO|nr:general stress protein [Microbacterium album]GGH49585.1 hypothetical protein GCM10010921_27810 [Microbacterium album]